MTLQDSAPAWVRERRKPTRAELAAKHIADGGSVAGPAPESDTFFTDAAPPVLPTKARVIDHDWTEDK
jgi:hypothetical protein